MTAVELIRQFPVQAALAAGFYLSIALLCLSWRARALFASTFELERTSIGHVRSLDSIRGLAALLVAGFHTWQWLRPLHDEVGNALPFLQEGNRGVPIFAALSGYLIFKIVRDRVKTGADVRSYAARRFLRIWPLYAATSVACVLVMWAAGIPPSLMAIAADLSMLRTFGYPGFLNPPAWSIYVEVGFYIAAPILVALCRRWSVVAAIVIAAAIFALGHTWAREFQLFPFFAAGIVAVEVAAWKGWPSNLRVPFSYVLLLLGVGLLVADFCGVQLLNEAVRAAAAAIGGTFETDPSRSLDLFAAMTLILTACGITDFSVLSVYPLRVLGVISYSTYLWHGVLLAAGTWVGLDGLGGITGQNEYQGPSGGALSYFGLFMPALLFTAAVSYVLIERPFLRRRPVMTSAT